MPALSASQTSIRLSPELAKNRGEGASLSLEGGAAVLPSTEQGVRTAADLQPLAALSPTCRGSPSRPESPTSFPSSDFPWARRPRLRLCHTTGRTAVLGTGIPRKDRRSATDPGPNNTHPALLRTSPTRSATAHKSSLGAFSETFLSPALYGRYATWAWTVPRLARTSEHSGLSQQYGPRPSLPWPFRRLFAAN